MGIALNTAAVKFEANGTCTDAKVQTQLAAVGYQVVEFALMRRQFISG
jgi:hypothetical protein